MITKKVIDQLYRTYNKRPDSTDCLNVGLLFDYLFEHHGILIDEHNLYINSLDTSSPFHCIRLNHIHEITEVGDDIVIVLHSSMVILSKLSNQVSVHVKPVSRSIRDLFRRN